MKKFTLFLMSLFLTVGAMAQAELDGCYVTFTNVQKNGTEYSLYVNSNKQLLVSTEAASAVGESAKFLCTKVSEDKYTFYSETAGVYMVWRNGKNNTTDGYDGNDGTTTTYNSTYCDWTLSPSSNYSGGYYMTSKRANNNGGVLNILVSGAIDAWSSGEAWADGYSSVFRIEKVGEANTTSVSYNVDLTTGVLANYSTGQAGNWNYKWSFTTTAAKPCALTLAATNNANNIQANGNNMNIFAGTAADCEYKLSVPQGYLIESYSFDFVTSGNNAVTITPAGGSAVQSSTTKQTLAVNNINATETTFRLTGGNYGFTASNFVVVIAEDASVEDPIESAMTFNWTTSTPWTDAEGDLSSTVLNDNAMGYGIKYIEKEITVGGPRTATVTFRYTSGNCALNIRGVEVINQYGLAVAGDYHVGKAGGSHTDNVYTVKVAEAGTYKVRCYATFGANDRADATNGNITVAFAAADAASFSHDVTFTAEYATLYLGYQVAIPEGVEAYVVEGASDGYAHLVEIENAIPETTAVILKNVGDKTTYKFDYSSENITEFAGNLLMGSIANCYVTEEAYVLTKNGEEVCFGLASMNQLNEGAFLNNANKVYLPAGEVSAAAYYSSRFEGGTTGVEEVKTENGEVKAVFDLTGRKVEAISAPGIYIVNGVKRVVR